MEGGTTTWVDVKNKVAPWVEPARIGLTRGQADLPLDHVLNKRWSCS